MSLYFPFPVFNVLYKHSFTQNTTIRLFLASNSYKSLQVREIYSLIPQATFHLICSHYCDLTNKTKQNLYIFFSYFYSMASLICSLIHGSKGLPLTLRPRLTQLCSRCFRHFDIFAIILLLILPCVCYFSLTKICNWV